jgi:hypothetical protein
MNTKASVGRGLAILAVALCAAAWSPAYGQYTYFVSDWSDGEVFADASIETDFSDYLWAAAVEVDVYDPNGTVIASGANEAEACVDEGVDAYAEVEVTAETSQEGWYSSLAYYWIWDVLEDDWESDGYDYAWSYAYPPGSGPPSIDHISPTSIAYGAGDGYGSPYGYIGVYGTNLDSGGDSCVTVSFGTCFWASDTQVNIQYDESVGIGTYQISVTDDVGASSNSVNFIITGDSTPSISGVTPASPWQPGAVYTNFSLTGSGFGSTGTSSDVSFSCGGGACVDNFTVGNWSDGLITGTVTVDANAGGQTVTIAVQSTGYNGFNFQAGQGQSSQGSTTVQVQTVPAPRIIFNGNDVTGMQPQVYIGQQINLTWRNNGGPGSNLTWTIEGNPIAGINPTSSSGFNVNTNVSTTNPTLYWLTPGQYQVMLSLTVPGTNATFPVQALFEVQAPNPTFNRTVQGSNAIVVDNNCKDPSGQYALGIHFGGCGSTPGASFIVAPDGSPGGYEFEQVVFSKVITADGAAIPGLDCTPSPAATDNYYPYVVGNSAQDSPGLLDLSYSVNTYQIDESFQMTVLYNPYPSSGGIYVPLYSVDWEWYTTASAPGGWLNGIDWGATGTPSSESGEFPPYPTWSGACANN